jgi:hypothetical protein
MKRTAAEIAAVWAAIDALRNGEDLFPDSALDDPLAVPAPPQILRLI